jgi:hypothetical protein
MTPTALDYADADDDADDYDYDSGTEGPSEIVYAPEDDVDPSDSSGVNSDDPSDSDDDENNATSLGGGSGTARTNAVIDVWQEFSEEDIDTSSRGQYMMAARWRQPTALQHQSPQTRRSSSWTCSTRRVKDERTVCALRKVSEQGRKYRFVLHRAWVRGIMHALQRCNSGMKSFTF